MSRLSLLLALCIALVAAPTAGADPIAAPSAPPAPPGAPREFRGVWVASVGNIDWPSKPGLSTGAQQAELLSILDRAEALHLNAVLLQVRPAGDALYASPYEPWSEYLSGVMGRAPEPYYDPLAFAVAEAHRRGLELHAWFNPFRARNSGARGEAAPKHISRTHPEWVRRYGGFLWMDPGEPEVREMAERVIVDVVKRYDVDGVHIDDYFYPYREPAPRGGGYLPFPDDRSWTRYQRSGGTLARDDWRRSNVDEFVERLYARVKAEKPWVKVGISPFGIWRPRNPASVRGLDAYVELFADSRKWIRNGWLDYLAPQLYWPTSAPQQSYVELLRWWVAQNAQARHIWPGNYTSRVGDPRQPTWTPDELLAQIRVTRDERGAGGNIHFSMKSLLGETSRVAGPLRSGAYSAAALVPASPWLERGAPPGAIVRVATTTPAAGGVELQLGSDAPEAVRRWIVRARFGDQWSLRLVPGTQRSYFIESASNGALPSEVIVSAVDRAGVEGPTTLVPLRSGVRGK